MGNRTLATVFLFVFTVTASAAEVRLRSSAACTAPIVRLADVAEVFSDDARIAAALAEIPLCPAPAAGSQRSLSQHEVRQLLTFSGVETSAALVTGSETVTVIAEAASSALAAKRRLVATGIRQAVFATDVETTDKRPPARAAARLPIAASPDIKEPSSPPLVDRGATVTVQARAAGVTITTSGKAVEAGGAGEAVLVELADTKQRVLARVTGPQAVEVTVGSGGASTAPSRPAVAANAANP